MNKKLERLIRKKAVNFAVKELLEGDGCYTSGWFSANDLEAMFDCCRLQFITCSREESFPKPIVISRRKHLWNLVEVIDYLNSKGCDISLGNLNKRPKILNRRQVSNYLGISMPLLLKLIHIDGFPKPITNRIRNNLYDVDVIDQWLKTRRKLGYFGGSLPVKPEKSP